MFYNLVEGKQNNIESNEITLTDINYILEEDSFIIKKLLLEDQIIKSLNFPNYIIDLAVEVIINKKSIHDLNNILISSGVPLYSLILASISKCREKYKDLKKFKLSNHIIITSNKNNLVKVLNIAKELEKKVIIDGRTISLIDYERILSQYSIEELENKNIQINYLDQSNIISLKALYHTAVIVDTITKKIQKYNLSPIEQIIYTYDMVKERKYKECNEDKDSPRDLDKIIESEYTVCVGHSNLLIAILENLGINAKPLISTKIKHQRTAVYIKDEKYKIDGVYVFDPCYDCKKSNNYIDNYNYFGLLLNESEIDSPSTTNEINNISYEEFLSIYEENCLPVELRINNIQKTEYMLKRAFAFINESSFETVSSIIRTYIFTNEKEKKFVYEVYKNYYIKYHPPRIKPITMFNALYNVRLIEYYEGIIDKVDIDKIIEAVRDREVSQIITYDKCDDKTEKFIKSLEKDYQVLNILSHELDKKTEVLEEKQIHIKLLKLLRNNKK